jgi:hypothetical protein
MMFLHGSRAVARLSVVPALALALATGACSSSETGPGPDAHVPTSAKLFVNGVDETANLILPAGATTRVQIKFYLADGSEETTIETTHFSSLTFTPTVLATPAGVADHRFQWDVTAQGAAGTGTVMVGFGHDDLADEDSFGPFPVTVQ